MLYSSWVQRVRSGDEISQEGDFDPQDMGSNTWDIFDIQSMKVYRVVME